MELIERAKNILIAPRKEWDVIETENDNQEKVLMGYLIWLALIPAIASFIGYGLIGYHFMGVKVGGGLMWGFRHALQQFISVIAGAYLTAYVFNYLAPKYGGRQDFHKAFQLSAYCYTPVCVGGVFYLHHSLSMLAGLAGLYGLYLLYLGVQPIMKVPKEKSATYFVISLLAMVVISLLVGLVIGLITGVGNRW